MPADDVFSVRLRKLVFCQDSVAPSFSDNRDEDVTGMIEYLLDIPNVDDRKRAIESRFDLLNVVPIRRHSDSEGGGGSTSQLILSLDNKVLLVMRSALPEDTMITVRNASPEERERMRWKWTSKDQGYWVRVREKKACEWILSGPAQTINTQCITEPSKDNLK